ncbi:MAG: hypothetical protein OIF47_14240 [Marinibacterium sp.]|nr:hypothetical protein [Marinibacterium sp.]
MTEITAQNARSAPRYILDPVAFALAMVGGPVLIGLLGAPLLLIPSFAVIIGGIPYLVIGTPVLALYLRHNPPQPGKIALLAFLADAAVLLLVSIVASNSGDPSDTELATLALACGLVFAPLWGATTAVLYRRLRHPIYTHPCPL